jgi:formylglycine-generating enzyme required for sulfatase activity
MDMNKCVSKKNIDPKALKQLFVKGNLFLILCVSMHLISGCNSISPTEVQATSIPMSVPPENPSVGSTWVQKKDGITMVYVPAGEFKMGSENGLDDEKPVHTVYLDAFWIDQTEVTNAMYAKCVEAATCVPPPVQQIRSSRK